MITTTAQHCIAAIGLNANLQDLIILPSPAQRYISSTCIIAQNNNCHR